MVDRGDVTQDHESMRLHVQTFADYALSEPAPAPTYRTRIKSGPAHIYGDSWTPSKSSRMPNGQAWLYPGWLVFLSLSKLQPGELVPLLSGSGARMFAEEYKEAMRLQSVGSLIREGYMSLTSSERDRLKERMANPNSWFMPLSTVADVQTRRDLLTVVTVWVTTTDGRRFVLGPSQAPGKGYFQSAKSGFGARWEPKLQDALIRGIEPRT